MDEDKYNEYAAEEHQRIEREAKVITRGCGLMALIVAALVAVIIIFIKLLSKA